MPKKSHKIKLYILLVIAALGGLYYYNNSSVNAADALDPSLKGKKVTVYKSPTCGCCANYISYLRKNGLEVEVVNENDVTKTKEKYRIPADLYSCHTTIIDDYFVEGHIPLKAINKLLTEKPDILGIGMPGMPSGSPGMPGKKLSLFLIDAVDKDGNINSYFEL